MAGGWRATTDVSMKAQKEAMRMQCTADGWRCQEDGRQWVSEISRGIWMTCGREQSGIANNNFIVLLIIDVGVLRQSAVQYLVSSFDRCEICQTELFFMPAFRDHLRQLVEQELLRCRQDVEFFCAT